MTGLLAGCSTGADKPVDTYVNPYVDAGLRDSTVPQTDSAPPPSEASVQDAGRTSDASDASDGSAADASDASDGAACPTGQTFCGGSCTDTKRDSTNCGRCADVDGAGQCPMTLVCTGGQCACQVDAGQTLCGNGPSSACVITATDPNNCGMCGRSCQGSMCAEGLCQPTVVAQPGSGTTIGDIVVDAQNMYWTQSGTTTPAIGKKPIAGGSITIVAMGGNVSDPRGIALEAVKPPNNPLNLYWVDYANGAVEKWPLMAMSATPTELVAPQQDGGPPPPPSPTDLAVDAQTVYWLSFDGGQVLSIPIGGGTWSVIATGEDHPVSIAIDDTNVYWVDQGSPGGTGSVKQASKTAAGRTVLTLATGETAPWDIAVYGTNVYWTNKTNPGTIKTAPIGSSNAVTTLAPFSSSAQSLGTPYGIAVDATDIYWTNYLDNTVMRLPLAGGQLPFIIATGQNNPAAITLDAKNVYWVNQGAGTIVQVGK